jgi:8-oxo-dGTP pyrophosphatase MutT (NUDIX family)
VIESADDEQALADLGGTPGESASDAAVRETAGESGITVQVTDLAGIYTDACHVIADPRAGLVRQPFAVCFHARPLCGSPGGDEVETSDARWFTVGDIPALPIRPALRLRIRHGLIPPVPATSADTGLPRPAGPPAAGVDERGS